MPSARVVIDTNVLISHLLVAGSPASLAAGRALTHTQVLMSDATLSELADVLGRAKFDPYASRESRKDHRHRRAGHHWSRRRPRSLGRTIGVRTRAVTNWRTGCSPLLKVREEGRRQ